MGTLMLQNKRITTFFGLKDIAERSPITELHVNGNELTSFEHFGTQPELQVLHAEDNRISSFLGMTKQKALHSLYLRGSPIAAQPHYRIMALLTVGFSLKHIDGKAVEAAERDIARKLGPSAALAVSYGWLLDTTPRSAADYDKIIVELRKARRSLAPGDNSSHHVRTIAMSLAAATVEPHDRDGLSVTAETVELQNRALLHFAKRVAQLEQIVTDLHSALSAAAAVKRPQQTFDGGNASPSTSLGAPMTTAELLAASSVVFSRGITVGGLHPSSIVQCVVSFSQDTVEFQNFFTRNCIAEIKFSDVSGCRANRVEDSEGKLLIGTKDGLVLDVHFRDVATFGATVKLLQLRCPGVIPDVPAGADVAAQHASESQSVELRETVAPPPVKPAEPIVPVSAAVNEPPVRLNSLSAPVDSRPAIQPPKNPEPEPAPQSPLVQFSEVRREDSTKAPLPISVNTTPAAQSIPKATPPSSPLVAIPSAQTKPSSPKQLALASRRSASSSMDFGSSTSAEMQKSNISSVPSGTSHPPPSAVAAPPVQRERRIDGSASASVPTSRGAPAASATAGASSGPPESLPPRRATAAQDDDSDVSPPRPVPKRGAWRGKEIRELMIDSSDSD